jgi:hypothetical protein
LGRDGDHPKPATFLGDTNISPRNLALTIITGFLACPKEGATSFFNSLNDSSGEKADTHGVREHRGEHRVGKKEASSNGKGAPTPTRKPHIPFCNNGSKIGEPQLVSK